VNSIERVAAQKWFHAIDFGEFASQGRFRPGTPQNITLYGAFDFLRTMDLSQARVLDIGTYDGIVAFGARKLGSPSVFAVDTHENTAFLLARELLGYTNSDINYYTGIQIASLAEIFPKENFDVIVCCGVFYHMLHPMQAFTETRKLLGEGGVLILETPYDHTRPEALLIFNGIDKIVNEPYTYFVPTKSALEGMAQLSGFKVMGYRILNAPRRITYLLKAVSRSVLIDDHATPAFIIQMLKRDTCDDSFRFKDLEKVNRKSPFLGNFDTIGSSREVDPKTHLVNFPFHPPKEKPAYGTTRFEAEDGNTKIL